MTVSLLFDWLRIFDAYISRTAGRKALLLIDNCPAHGDLETIPSLQHVDMLFLQRNTTSKI